MRSVALVMLAVIALMLSWSPLAPVINADGLPDLVVADITVQPDPPMARSLAKVYFQVRNQGQAGTAAFGMKLYFDGAFLAQGDVNGLAADAVRTYYWEIVWPSDVSAHTLRIVADADAAVTESDEGNNERSESFTGVQSPAGPLGMVAYWKFDEQGGNVAFDSIGGNVGTITGTSRTVGVVGGALEFDGASYIRVPHSVALGFAGEGSVEMWMKHNGDIGTLLWKRIYAGSWGWTLYFGFPNSLVGYVNNRAEWATAMVSPGQWQHVVMTYQSGLMKIFINGVLSGSTSSPLGFEPTSVDLLIGRDSIGNYFKGEMDEVAVYNRALSAEEIVLHYQGGLNGADYLSASGQAPAPATVNVALSGSDATGDGSQAKPYRTIQKSIDMALNGDMVLVAAGMYEEHIDFKGKAITVRSQTGPAQTTIGNPDYPMEGSVVRFVSGETADAILDGFTLTRGMGTPNPSWFSQLFGGGIYSANGANPTIINSIIRLNVANWGGGIAFGDGGRATIINSLIQDNWSTVGGGIDSWVGGVVTVINSVIGANHATLGGGGIRSKSNLSLINSTVVGNRTDGQVGGGIMGDGTAVVNSIIRDNLAPAFPETAEIGGSAAVTYSNVKGGWPGTGNIDSDPLFVDPAAWDYHLQPGSSSIDAGSNSAVPSGITSDYEGDARIVGGSVDMGADEHVALPAVGGLMRVSPGHDSTPTFNWSAVAGAASYQVRMDSASYASIGNVLTYTQPTALAGGNHTFYVRARDTAGNVGAEASLAFTVTTSAPTQGIMITSAQWTEQDSPVKLTGNLKVDAGVILTIAPGVTVDLNGFFIQVDGTLDARGTQEKNIVITNAVSLADSESRIYFTGLSAAWDATTGTGSVVEYAQITVASGRNGAIHISNASPKISKSRVTNPSWAGMSIQGGSPLVMDNTITGNDRSGILISGGSPQIIGNLLSDNRTAFYIGVGLFPFVGASPLIEKNLIQNNRRSEGDRYGVIRLDDGTPIIRNNTIYDNSYGIGVFGGSPTITQNNVYGNQDYDVHLFEGRDGSGDLQASENWWGTTDLTSINSHVYDNQDDFRLGTVTIVPILPAPAPLAPLPILIPAPTNLVRTTPANDNTPTFTWDAVAGVVSYEVKLDAGGYSNIGNVMTFTVAAPPPGLPNGDHTLLVRGKSISGIASTPATINFTINTTPPTLTLSPNTGVPGSQFTVAGSAFTPGSTIPIGGLTWSGAAASLNPAAAIPIDGAGNFSVTASVPGDVGAVGIPGAKTITAVDGAGMTGTGTFTIPGRVLTLGASSGARGSGLQVAGSGFGAGTAVIVTMGGTVLGAANNNANGAFTATLTVPSNASLGVNAVTAVDNQFSALTASANFTVLTPGLAVSPASASAGAIVRFSGSNYPGSIAITGLQFGNGGPIVPVNTASSAVGDWTADVAVPSLSPGAVVVTSVPAGGSTILTVLAAPEQWRVDMGITTVPGTGSVTMGNLAFGAKEGASNAFSASEGDAVAPPDPQEGVNAYFSYPINDPVLTRKLNKSIVAPASSIIWDLVVKTVVGQNAQMTITWDVSQVPAKYASVQLLDGSGAVLRDMKTANSYQFAVEPDRQYNFKVRASESVTFSLQLKAGWNLISLPVQPSVNTPSVLLPDVVQLYEWNAEQKSYTVPTQLVPGKGYWALVFSDVTQTISGTPVSQYQLNGVAGWHLVGSLSVDGKIVVESGTVWDQFYGWDATSKSYQLGTTLAPGKGYWVLGFTQFSASTAPKP